MIKFIKSLFNRKPEIHLKFMNPDDPEFLEKRRSGSLIEIHLTDDESNELQKCNEKQFEKVLYRILQKKTGEKR
ncbi:hypothetical protein UFOVP1361_35 [uncultured Caudovirales phage]|uniref:Uncharacterized protein n=1 Tax=uncultured Caudovirales phage TaxID=2100421 RepID=A0A6J5RUW7_9CAUD|nr:hypothetical protein UFOVP1361_35 [uncultured Caudovirales phage]